MSKNSFFKDLKERQNDGEISDIIEEYRIELLLLYLLEQRDELPEAIREIVEDSSLSVREKIIKSVNSLQNSKILFVILRELLKNRETILESIEKSRTEILEKINELSTIENREEDSSKSFTDFLVTCKPGDELIIEAGKRLKLVYIPVSETVVIKNREDDSIVFSGEAYLQEIDAAIVTDIVVKHLQLIKLGDKYYKLGRNGILGSRVYSFKNSPELFKQFVVELEKRL